MNSPEADYKECVERTQYYPSGLPWVERLTDSFTANPWKYNGKEFIEMHGLDEYDFEMHSGYSLSTMIRNTLTIIGGMLAGKGIPYQINVYGNQHVRSTLP